MVLLEPGESLREVREHVVTCATVSPERTPFQFPITVEFSVSNVPEPAIKLHYAGLHNPPAELLFHLPG
jgi:hypothetical protein